MWNRVTRVENECVSLALLAPYMYKRNVNNYLLCFLSTINGTTELSYGFEFTSRFVMSTFLCRRKKKLLKDCRVFISIVTLAFSPDLENKVTVRYLPPGIEQNSRKITFYAREHLSWHKFMTPLHFHGFKAKQKFCMLNFSRRLISKT